MRSRLATGYLGSFLVLTMILLSPSPGLMTLPIPDDEPYSPAIAIFADASHLGKRVTDDSSRIHLGMVSISRASLARLTQVADIQSHFLGRAPTPPYDQYPIRAPPVV